MLRSSVVVFAALLGYCFLKSKLYSHHYASIAAIIAGLVFVGISEALSGADGDNVSTGAIMMLGIGMQITGQFFGAAGYTAEEKLLGDDNSLDPLILIGWEGFWTTCVWLILLPIL